MKYDWLENTVFYEIYPTSFYDSNGDGIGDINGIIEKLPYVRDLGINAIWLNPCFASPFMDGGYDITDYYSVDARFGTNEDLYRLFSIAKEMGIRICLDLVVGHTSWQHPWFIQSQKQEKNEYTDRYIWRDEADPLGSNDGKFISGLSERSAAFNVNYYACQPSINFGYAHPKAKYQLSTDSPAAIASRDEVIKICKFWLAHGAGGFRVDMANSLIKNDSISKKANIKLWNHIIFEVKKDYPESIFISEWFYPPQSIGKSSFDIDFNSGGDIYSVWWNSSKPHQDYNKYCWLGEYSSIRNYIVAKAVMNVFRNGVKKRGYQAIVLTNHDKHRMSMGRSYDMMKLVFVYHLTMQHVPFIYYGDEVGQSYQFIPTKDGGYHRTGSRTPMQWDNSKNRGFSSAPTKNLYLPVESDEYRCVSAQANVEGSLLETVRYLIKLRRTLSCLRTDAKYKIVKDIPNPHIFKRENDDEAVYVLLAPKKKELTVKLNFIKGRDYKVLYSNNVEISGTKAHIKGESCAIIHIKKH